VKRFLVSSLLIVLGSLILGTIVFRRIENVIYDGKVGLFSRRIDAPVVYVEIDQFSLDFYSRQFNLNWPWPRSLYAKAIAYLSRCGARAIAVDMIFSEGSPYEGEDETLAAAIGRAGNVFLPLFFTAQPHPEASVSRFALNRGVPGIRVSVQRKQGVVAPVEPILDALRGAGNAAEERGAESVYRELSHFVEFQGRAYPSFSLAIARALDPDLDLHRIPFNPDGSLALAFYRDNSFTSVPIAQVIQSQVRFEEGNAPELSAKLFRGKIVFIGARALGLLDRRPSPLKADGSGFELHAAALTNFLRRDFIRDVPPLVALLLLVVFVVALNFLLARCKSYIVQGAVSLAFLLLAWAAGYALFVLRLNLRLLPLTLAVALTSTYDIYHRYLIVRREKRFIQGAFQNYLSDSLLRQIMRDPQALVLGGEKKNVTVFFSDLAGFTSFSEKMMPEEVVSLLNVYLERMTTIILAHDGFVNKFEGDAIMAFWGAPLEMADHAAKAMAAALECQTALAELNLEFRRSALPELHMRVGINTGQAIVGNIGSKKRFEYTAIGDTVNLASRLEGINKQYRTRIICGSLSRQLAGDAVVCRRLDRVRVKGKVNPEEIFEVVGLETDVSAERVARLSEFETGLGLYFAGEFDRAADVFARLDDDPAAAVFLERCRILRQQKPETWDGVMTFTEK